jgi:hypothetical protein
MAIAVAALALAAPAMAAITLTWKQAPAALGNSHDGAFKWVVKGAGHVKCGLAGTKLERCEGQKATLHGLPEGRHTFDVVAFAVPVKGKPAPKPKVFFYSWTTDYTPPTEGKVEGGSADWTTANVSFTASASDPHGIRAYRYWDYWHGAWSPVRLGNQYTATTSGVHDVQFEAEDKAGNWSTWFPGMGTPTATAKIDRDRPANATPTLLGDTPRTDNTQLSGSWTGGSDALSGLAGYEVCFSSHSDGGDCGTTAVVPWAAKQIGDSPFTASSLSLDSGTYYFCVRTKDNAGNYSLAGCSAGDVVDTTAPTPPTDVKDGHSNGQDEVATSNTTDAYVNWSDGTDSGSGFKESQVCVSNDVDGADCDSTADVAWTDAQPGASPYHFGNLALLDGHTYHSCVRSVDNAGNHSAAVCSNGFEVDNQAPNAPTAVFTTTTGANASPEATNSADLEGVSWTAGTDNGISGIQGARWCVISMSTMPAQTADSCSEGGDAPAWSSVVAGTTSASTPAQTSGDGSYEICVEMVDWAASHSTPVCSAQIMLDTVPPSAPSGLTASEASFTQIDTSWTNGADDGSGSGIAGTELCVSLDSAGADCGAGAMVPWISTAGSPASLTNLTLTPGTQYYFCARMLDAAGNTSTKACQPVAFLT